MEIKMEYTKKTVDNVTKFFSRRFPEKDIEFEKKCGYFYEWCRRLERGTHIACSDTESVKAWADVL